MAKMSKTAVNLSKQRKRGVGLAAMAVSAKKQMDAKPKLEEQKRKGTQPRSLLY
jgi:hypothetical protein